MPQRPFDSMTRTALLLTLALWLGGLVTLFIFVQALFSHDRSTAVVAAPALFDVFDLYQRGLGVVAVLLAILTVWRRGGAAAWLVFAVVLLSAAFAATIAFYVMPELRALMADNLADHDRFRAMHGLSMQLYVGETLLVLAGFVVMSMAGPAAPRADAP